MTNTILYAKLNLEGYMKAVEYFMQGNSCSESIILEAIEKKYCDKDLLSVATGFSGGISSGCLCGAVAGSIMVISSLFGKENKYNNPLKARELSKEFMTKFKEAHKATCCRVLSKGFEMHSPERKQHCCNFVEFCSNLLSEIVEKELVKNG